MKNSSIVTLIILLIVTVTIIVFISKTGEDSGINLTLEQLERVNELSNWQEYNGIEYAIGMRIIAVRTANDQKLLWALPAEEYEDKIDDQTAKLYTTVVKVSFIIPGATIVIPKPIRKTIKG